MAADDPQKRVSHEDLINFPSLSVTLPAVLVHCHALWQWRDSVDLSLHQYRSSFGSPLGPSSGTDSRKLFVQLASHS